MKKLFSSKKRVTAIGVLTAATMLGGGMAVAYWTNSGSGDGSATTGTTVDFTVNGTDVSPGTLTPGGPSQTIGVTVENNGTGVERVTKVTAKVAVDATTPWTAQADETKPACTASDFSLGGANPGLSFDLAGLPQDILAGAANATPLSVSIQMVNTTTNQDNCKSVTVPIWFEAS